MTVDNGTEWLWARPGPAGYEVLSVPVFCYGVSRGSVVRAAVGDAGTLVCGTVLHASPGATIRCYVAEGAPASDVYRLDVVPAAREAGIVIGPATFFDPDVVAIHVHDRADVLRVGALLDELHASGKVRFWEIGDPADDDAQEEPSTAAPWSLEHPHPDAGEGCVAEDAADADASAERPREHG